MIQKRSVAEKTIEQFAELNDKRGQFWGLYIVLDYEIHEVLEFLELESIMGYNLTANHELNPFEHFGIEKLIEENRMKYNSILKKMATLKGTDTLLNFQYTYMEAVAKRNSGNINRSRRNN